MLAANQVPGYICCSCTARSSMMLPARLPAQSTGLHALQERLTLKHKNTSKWAKRALRRGINVMDEGTKEAMQEQLRLGMALRQKVCAAPAPPAKQQA